MLNITGGTLDTLPPPTASVDFGTETGINFGDPVNAQDASTKSYVDLHGDRNYYSASFTIPETTCFPCAGFVTFAGNCYATIPNGSNLFVMGGTGNLLGPPNTYADTHAFGGLQQVTLKTVQDWPIVSNVLTNVPGLSFAATAGMSYEVECAVQMRAIGSASYGAGFALAYSGTLVATTDTCFFTGSSNAFTSGQLAIGATANPTVGNTLQPYIKVYAIIRALTAGNITFQFASDNTHVTLLNKNSRMTVTTLGINQN